MGRILEEAYKHKGAVFIEMLQNCPVFNDGVWEGVKDDPKGKQIRLEQGKPLVYADGTKGNALGAGMKPEIVDVVGGDTSKLLVGEAVDGVLLGEAELRRAHDEPGRLELLEDLGHPPTASHSYRRRCGDFKTLPRTFG